MLAPLNPFFYHRYLNLNSHIYFRWVNPLFERKIHLLEISDTHWDYCKSWLDIWRSSTSAQNEHLIHSCHTYEMCLLDSKIVPWDSRNNFIMLSINPNQIGEVQLSILSLIRRNRTSLSFVWFKDTLNLLHCVTCIHLFIYSSLFFPSTFFVFSIFTSISFLFYFYFLFSWLFLSLPFPGACTQRDISPWQFYHTRWHTNIQSGIGTLSKQISQAQSATT